MINNLLQFFLFFSFTANQMKVDAELNGNIPQFTENEVFVLQGHESEVFSCAWNPRRSLLASGSGDSTARLWEIQNLTKAGVTSTTLNHSPNPGDKSKDITTLDWNVRLPLLILPFLSSPFSSSFAFSRPSAFHLLTPRPSLIRRELDRFWQPDLMMEWPAFGPRKGS